MRYIIRPLQVTYTQQNGNNSCENRVALLKRNKYWHNEEKDDKQLHWISVWI